MQGLEFELPLVDDGAGGLCTRNRVSPYLLAAAGMPLAALPEGYYPLAPGAAKGPASFSMPRFAEVVHHQWIAAPVETVRSQFADLDHHIRAGVHPKLSFQVLESSPTGARFVRTEAAVMIALFALFLAAQFMGFGLALP